MPHKGQRVRWALVEIPNLDLVGRSLDGREVSMSQSLAKIYLHLIFSAKNRERLIPDGIRPDLHSYPGGILNGLGCVPVEINSEPDHMHILLILSRTETVANVVGQVKKSFSRRIPRVPSTV